MNILFLDNLRNLNMFIISILIGTISYAQNKEIENKYEVLDSLHSVYNGGYSKEAFDMHHKLLKKSSKISYTKGILAAYKSLMWYHGVSTKPSLDSVLYYADLFEVNLAKVDKQQNSKMLESLYLPEYYLNKGQIISVIFGLPEQGLESYFKAYPLIPADDTNLSIAYQVAIAEIYIHKLQHDKALEVLTPLLKDTTDLEPYMKIKLLQNIAVNYTRKKMPEKSYPLHKEILKLANKIDNVRNILWTKNQMTKDYFLMGETQKAIDSALAIKNYAFENDLNGVIKGNNDTYLSTYYHALGDLDKAIAYRKEVLKSSEGIEFKRDAYSILAEYYTENKQYLNAIGIYKKLGSAVDSLRTREKKTLTNYIDSNAKFLKEKETSQQMLFDIQLLEIKNKEQKLHLFSISIGLISVILLLGSIILFNKYKKGEKVIETLKSNEKKLLEEKITLRENELEASAIALSQRLEILTSIKNELNQITEPHIAKLEDVKLKINNLISSASDTYIITKKIESEYPTITTKLKNTYPELTDTQMRYCLLTKLNLSIKETATILNVTPNTVKVARSRLKKKLNIPSSMSIKLFLDDLTDDKS